MKKIILTLLAIVAITSVASAQYTAQLSPAGTVLKGNSEAGGYIGIYDGAFGVLGQYRFGIGGYSDLGLKDAIIDLDSRSREGDAGVSMAIDSKYQVMEVRIMDPIDLSVGGVFEFTYFKHYNNIVIGGTVIGSYPVRLNSGRSMNPYARLILGFDRSDPSWAGSDTDFNLALNMGTTFELSSKAKVIGEFQLDNDAAAFIMGLSFGM